eukprot:CAMPEP_0185271786 /NCGR_PEP_ID=MMETSP1359-20130426/45628_1 /TAXON_ID=552665 /ORGANISM="Bigelowiella longifila, Strain CCMP242" /LENGTH=188 /DNA_ID=CAMNT_0027863853 /DNA_START=1 /DNA_END=568 /DNA_ORIENTATION=-
MMDAVPLAQMAESTKAALKDHRHAIQEVMICSSLNNGGIEEIRGVLGSIIPQQQHREQEARRPADGRKGGRMALGKKTKQRATPRSSASKQIERGFDSNSRPAGSKRTSKRDREELRQKIRERREKGFTGGGAGTKTGKKKQGDGSGEPAVSSSPRRGGGDRIPEKHNMFQRVNTNAALVHAPTPGAL